MNPSRVPFVCSSCARAARAATISQTTRQFSLTTPRRFNDSVPEDASASIPRWMKTPQRLRQPIRLRPRSHQSATWRVNTDPEKLNAAYDNFLGRVGGNRLRGRDLLDEQTKVSFIRRIASIQLISSNSMNSVTNNTCPVVSDHPQIPRARCSGLQLAPRLPRKAYSRPANLLGPPLATPTVTSRDARGRSVPAPLTAKPGEYYIGEQSFGSSQIEIICTGLGVWIGQSGEMETEELGRHEVVRDGRCHG